MQKFRLILIILTLFPLVACNGNISFSTANIGSVTLTRDSAGNDQTTVFNPNDSFFLTVEALNAPESTLLNAEWVAVAVENVPENTVIDNEMLEAPTGTYTFDLANNNPWPQGSYRVDLYLTEELNQSIEFQVGEAVAENSVFDLVDGSGGEPATTTSEENAGITFGDGDRANSEELAPTSTPITSEESQPSETETGSAAEANTDEPIAASAEGEVMILDDVVTGVIQIEAQGSFVDPQIGNVNNSAGRGSGFIINSEGIAVTNNHVVTGAALLKVWVGGEPEPRNARILGVSECSDLAVIDIEGDGYNFLPWFEGDIDVGLDVYAAGFPLGDPEFTLTRGIVAKADANGDTTWASNEAVIQHDATINPGNSGGALVTDDGSVVAVNYAGVAETNQYFAISREEALPVIDILASGDDFLSLGINGRAVNNGEGLSGIWVASVKSGSPADNAGIQGGDIITRLQNLVLSTDGTMADYCDILRTHDADDVLSVEVLRFATEEVLEGQINGRELEQAFSFATAIDMVETSDPNATSYSEYVSVTDDSNSLIINVPAAWVDVDGSAWTNEGSVIGPSISASFNLDSFYNTWESPGVFFAAVDNPNVTTPEALDLFDYSSDCVYDSRSSYDDSVFIGQYDLWENCGGIGTVALVLASQPIGGNELVVVLVAARSEADFEALDNILSSFDFTN
ncbi:MAG: S1C family serine protease [Chloroflexota bacterium]